MTITVPVDACSRVRHRVEQLTNLQYKWIRYPQGAEEMIYDGSLCTTEIQSAIDAVHAAGGGTVIVPSGHHVVGPIQLRSRVSLHLEPGAHLHGSPNRDDYRSDQAFAPRFPATRGTSRFQNVVASGFRPLIWAENADDLSITGAGTIDGQSPAWVIPWMNSKPETWDTLNDLRPRDTICFYNCRRVRVEGVRLERSPCWTLVFDTCEHVSVHNVRIRNFEAINADGIDIVDTSFVTISDCDLWVTDDAICLKSCITDHTMSDVAVSNCVIRTLCNGLKIGTETLGNVENVTFSNVTIYNPVGDAKGAEGGINLCAMDGGSVRNINISNVVMRNVDCPIFLLAGRRQNRQAALRTSRSGLMERISISNIVADGARHTSWIVGQQDQPIRDVYLSNLNVRKTRDFYDEPVATPVPELPDAYPSPCRFGRRHVADDLPAHGLYLRHVEDIRVRAFRQRNTRADCRPFVTQDQCAGVSLTECSSQVRTSEAHR